MVEGRTQVERVRQASRERREREKEQLRQVILDAAGDLFLEHGYERFSLRQVAERIGYSATTIYLYFKDKDDLLFALAQQGFHRFYDTIAAAAAQTADPVARIEALGRAYIRFGLENPAHYQLVFMQRADFLFRARADDPQPLIAAFDVLRQVVQEAIDAGAYRPGDAEEYSNALWALVHGIVALAISKGFDWARAERTVQTALLMARRGLAAS